MAPKGGNKGKKRKDQPGKAAATTKSKKKKPQLPTQASRTDDSSKETSNKPEPEKAENKKKRPPNFVEEEDIILCRAVVNISQDSATGTDQTIEIYWQRIQSVFDELKGKDDDLEDLPDRTSSALKNRFDRHIKPGINRFNGFYKALKDQNPSGWNEDKFIEESCQNYLQAEGKPFPWSKCAPILWKCPKCDPIVCDLVADPEDPEKKANVVAKVMGEGKERPIGSKAAKAGKTKKPDAASIASIETAKLATMRDMNANSGLIATAMGFQAQTFNFQSAISALMDEAKMYRELGDEENCRRSMLAAQTERAAMQEARLEHRRTMMDSAKPPVSVDDTGDPPVSSVNVPGSGIKSGTATAANSVDTAAKKDTDLLNQQLRFFKMI